MKLILISCSGKKAPGGQPDPRPSRLAEALSPETYRKLLEARQELDSMLRGAPERGLGIDPAGENRYEPAYQRYQGIVYLFSDFYHLYPKFSGRVAIVTAMYGLLEGGDYIRNYNLRMNDSLPSGIRVDTFWRRHGLRHILMEYISRAGADEVHDLLPEKYHAVIRPWPGRGLPHYTPYDYLGCGQNSGYERAVSLKGLLGK
jgi:cytoplasmic iron level regulating protein YaaA (DUF328/UPF0246 family)